MFYPPRTIKAIRKAALTAYPNVAIGFLIANNYHHATNCSADNFEHFNIANYKAIAAKSRRGVQAVVVSKPDNKAYPNAKDMELQVRQNIPWMLVATNGKSTKEPIMFGDGAPIQSLIGRHFRHGISDCYAMARDYYRLNFGIILRDYPRDWDWWNTDLAEEKEDTNLYGYYFKSAGFRVTDEEEARNSQFGGMLLNFRSNRINHAGIIISPKRFLHHISARRPVDFRRISMIDSIHMWHRFVDTWVVFDPEFYKTLENPYLENSKQAKF